MSNDTAIGAAPASTPQAAPVHPTGARPPGAASGSACASCPLRALPCFLPADTAELQLIDTLKQCELDFGAGSTLIAEGAEDAPLYTLLAGWACRSQRLPDGRRQILGVLLPGDFIGLQQRMADRSPHAVQALTAVRVCVFRRDAVRRIHQQLPDLAMDLTWIAARGESVVDDHLLSVGRRTAYERLAATLLVLWLRARQLGLQRPDGSLPFPLRQRDLADLLGLSLVHTNRNLRRLVAQGLVTVPAEGLLRIDDAAALAHAGHLRWPLTIASRPLI